MAITIQNTPGTYYSAHGDIIFTVCDIVKATDPTTYPDYRYICDVYVGATLITRLKAYPRPDTKIGVFNIGNIIRDYVAASFSPVGNTVRAQEMGSGEFYIEATMKFGEEYGFTLYTNITVDSARVYYNHYNGRLIGQNTILSDYLDKPLTVRPSITPVSENAEFCFLPYLATDTDQVIFQVSTYRADNTGITIVDTPINPTAANNLQLFNVAPQSMSSLFNSSVAYYTVRVITPNITDEPIYRFNLVCEPRYEIFTLHFLNRFGGFESRDFTKVSRKTIDIQKQDYGKLPYTLDVCGVVSYKNANNVYNETRSVYSSQNQEKMVLNTDILTDEEYAWLGDLFQSPLVYIEMEGYFFPVLIKDSNYEFRKVINDKLTNITCNIEFGETFNAQFR